MTAASFMLNGAKRYENNPIPDNNLKLDVESLKIKYIIIMNILMFTFRTTEENSH